MSRKREELRAAWLGLKGLSVGAVLRRLNPIIRGWANYYRTVVASDAFARHCRSDLAPLGEFALPGFAAPQTVHGLPDESAPAGTA